MTDLNKYTSVAIKLSYEYGKIPICDKCDRPFMNGEPSDILLNLPRNVDRVKAKYQINNARVCDDCGIQKNGILITENMEDNLRTKTIKPLTKNGILDLNALQNADKVIHVD